MLLSEKAYDLVCKKYENEHKDRLKHIIGVAKMASFLAEKYGADSEKAKIAGFMHDYHKYESIEEFKKLVNKEDLEECLNCDVLFHSYASANAYLKLIGNDEDIYNAIRYHVFGRVNASLLEEIILISDYTEENRMYEDCIKCREILYNKGLYEAIYHSTIFTINHLLSKGITPHKEQYNVLAYYDKRRRNNGIIRYN